MSPDFNSLDHHSVGTAQVERRPDNADHALSGWAQWLRQGLRATFGLRLSALPADIPAGWVLFLFVLSSALSIGVRRMEIDGDAAFSLSGWLYGWAGTGLWLSVLGWCFWASRQHWRHASPVMAWVTLEWVTATVLYVISGVLSALALADLYPTFLLTSNGRWGLFAVFMLWAAVAHWRVAQALLTHKGAIAALVVSISAIGALSALWIQSSPWERDHSAEANRPQLELSQSVFEAQQTLFEAQAQALLPSEGPMPHVYGLVYAPYEGDVFQRESQMVGEVMAGRLGSQGRTLTLLNHAATTQTAPWATPANLERGLKAIGNKMNREQDVLVIYLTSHGGKGHRLASEHWPLKVPELTAEEVRRMLDGAGIRYRAVLISACYSGGWIDPLKSDGTLVMTAADRTHTSYGCGSRSELTFFGRAIFDEEMRNNLSFEQAFALAVPRIKQREEEAGKDDGFSNPQIAVGPGFRQHWTNVVQPALNATP